MSVTDGKVCSSNEELGDATTESTDWLLSTKGGTIRICSSRTPSGPTATGLAGELCWDENFLYICIATNTWRRVATTALLWI